MRAHKDSLSKSTLKSVNHSKYNKVARNKAPVDISKEYEFRPDGYRRKRKVEK